MKKPKARKLTLKAQVEILRKNESSLRSTIARLSSIIADHRLCEDLTKIVCPVCNGTVETHRSYAAAYRHLLDHAVPDAVAA